MENVNPIRSIGVLSYKVDSLKYRGRRAGYGNIVKIGNDIAIVTAAHCVYEIGIDKFNMDMNFSTVYEQLKDRIPIETAIIHKKWGINHKIECDTAFLLPRKGTYDSERYYSIASSIKEDFQFENHSEVFITFVKGIINKRIKCVGLQGIQETLYENKMLGVKFKGKQGLSGSPWFCCENGEWEQITLTSSKLKSRKNTLWGPEWGSETKEILNYVQSKKLDDQNLMIQKIRQERRNGI